MLLLKLPFAHGSGADAPRRQIEPGSHGSQPVALAAGWYVPPSQGVHSDAPNDADTEPGAHGVGTAEAGEHELPGGHGEHCDWSERSVLLLKLPFAHGSGADAPRRQIEPGSHGSQPVALAAGWYVPPSQGVHSDAPNDADTEPGAHGVGTAEAGEHELPGGHGEHCDWSERPVLLLKLPPLHGAGTAVALPQM